MAAKGNTELSKNEKDALLGLFSGCECLWNTKCGDYNVRNIRDASLLTIVNGMRVELGKELTIAQVRSLLQGVQSEYITELQQIEAEKKKPNNNYKSEWRYFVFLDSFLREHVTELEKVFQADANSTEDSAIEIAAGEGNDFSDNADTFVSGSEAEYRASPADRQGSSAGARKLAGGGGGGGRKAQKPASDSEDTDVDYQVEVPPQRAPSARQTASKKRTFSVPDIVGNTTATTTKKTSAGRGSNAGGGGRNNNNNVGGGGGGGGGGVRGGSGSGNNNNPTATNTNRPPPGQSPTTTSNNNNSADLTWQMAETLKTMQTLLAHTLTEQDQPSLVFARHLSRELDQIPDYVARKRCMLDLQRVVTGYQTGRQKRVKFNVKREKGYVDHHQDGGDEDDDGVSAGEGTSQSHHRLMADEEDSVPMFFD